MVTRVPMRTQRRIDHTPLSSKLERKARTSLFPEMSGMEAWMNSSPMKRRPKPRKISERSLIFVFLENMRGRATAIERRDRTVMSMEKPRRATIHPVTVVPMFAPIMTPIADTRFISPAFTKETTMTVVADEDWMTTVMRKPVRMESSLFPVIISMVLLNFPEAAFCKPWESICIP